MAPKGQHTRSYQIFLTVGIILVAVALISLAVFRQEVLSAIGTFRQPVQTCDCSIPPDRASSQAHEHHGNTPAEHDQPFVPTIYSDLTILEELPPANVLWVNKTGPEEPEAWGISMFHALHCVKMWKESLDPATVMQSHVHSDAEYAEHANHCVKYLVQSIFCAGDGTIQPAEEVIMGDKHGRRIFGMGYEHQCRDTSLLFHMNGQMVNDWSWKQGDTLHSVSG